VKSLALALFFLAAGCSTFPPPVPRGGDLIWSKQVAYGASAWRHEFEKHGVHAPVLFICHGGPNERGEWWCYPDPPHVPAPVEAVAWMLHDLYPDRDIVLVCCNGGGTPLHIPRVWYVKKVLWTSPGFEWMDDFVGVDNAGTFAEFGKG
jgi:hypothetical protein